LKRSVTTCSTPDEACSTSDVACSTPKGISFLPQLAALNIV
jgi:hypothetical protein